MPTLSQQIGRLLLFLGLLHGGPGLGLGAEPAHWVGVAQVDITPVEPIRLTGFAARRSPSTGSGQSLRAKALAVGTRTSTRGVLLTLELCGISHQTYVAILERLERSCQLGPDQIAISCSHTHSGPATTGWAPNIVARTLTGEQEQAIERYTARLLDQVEQVVRQAIAHRAPVFLSRTQGSVPFAINRRTGTNTQVRIGENPSGPVDHSLPVLKVEDSHGGLVALLATYACHCTTVGSDYNQTCGDWAGFAQAALERQHPGTLSFITIGCGADANPSPRGGPDSGLALARQHGETLAREVDRLLGTEWMPLTSGLHVQRVTLRLPFARAFTRQEWARRAALPDIVGYHAGRWLARWDAGQVIPDALPYYISAWTFGDQLSMVFLSGEVVVDYALRLRRELDGSRLWITGYANYVPCYIPSRRILEEGGYEAEGSCWWYDLPAQLALGTEDRILQAVHHALPASYRRPHHSHP